ncbi:hypothetical protein SLEP1_g46703 [Rubroshorea leprosula]|uniref:DUF7745 domain-containing protein n=1 Tax=Rubroshorea leprosula TaxID=152421 RepID=A0AAV5LPW7_9ROSI|nr:hypothetical protein SLEP1_g46703 [Rubroshorea leprosula]
MASGKRLEAMTPSQRIKFVVLGIYGMVIFPIYVKTIAPMVIAFFEQLLHTSAFNPASTVVAETLWSMKEIRAKGSGRFLGCIELFTTWAQGHLKGPQFEALFSIPVKDRKTEDWHRSLLATTVNDVRFVLPTWSATHYLAPFEGHHSIPLLGIHGGVLYSMELASRQFGKAQNAPYLDDALQSHFDYMSSSVIVNKVFEAHKMWERCRMLPIWKDKGTRSQYEQWRSSWIAKLSLPWKVTNTKNSTIMDLTAKLELSHAQRCQLLEKYDELALDYELLKRGKELSDRQVVELKDKIASLEKDLAASKEICGKQKRSLNFAEEQRKRLLRVKANLKAREKENKELIEKVTRNMASHTSKAQASSPKTLLEFVARTQRLNEETISYLHELTKDNEDLCKANKHLEEQLQDMTINRNLYKIAMEDMCYQLQVKKQKNQALLEEDIGLCEIIIDIATLVSQFEGRMAETHHHIAQRTHLIERGFFQLVFDFIFDMSNMLRRLY